MCAHISIYILYMVCVPVQVQARNETLKLCPEILGAFYLSFLLIETHFNNIMVFGVFTTDP